MRSTESFWTRAARSAGDDITWWILFMSGAGIGASLLALSVLLRSGQEVTRRAILGALLHSFIWGIVIFLMAYSTLKNDLPMLLGLSILSGLGTASVADIVLMLIKQRLGITVTINPPAKKE